MNNDMDDLFDNNNGQPKATRLSSLQIDENNQARSFDKNYSGFIRKVQFTLPILAVILVIIIFNWNKFESGSDKIVPIKEEDVQPQIRQEIGKNELINPRFESMDEKGQPYVLTADKAIQEDGEKGDMFLETPHGKMTLKSGKVLTLQAVNGTYNQIEQYLDLNENVILTHSDGYDLKTRILHVDLNENKAWSDQPVTVVGPQGAIAALGITAKSDDETVIFDGPATMTIKTETENLGFGKAMP